MHVDTCGLCALFASRCEVPRSASARLQVAAEQGWTKASVCLRSPTVLERIKDAWVGALLIFQLGPFASKIAIKWWRGWHALKHAHHEDGAALAQYSSLVEV